MAKNDYVVTEAGLEWAQAALPGKTVEKDKTYELDITVQQEKALVAAGWLIPKKGK